MARLDDRAWIPAYLEARALRDHIAGFLQSDPQRAAELAARLLGAVADRPQASKGALAAAWRARAETLLYTGEYKAARSAYERACDFASEAREAGLLGQILVGRIGTLQVMGEFEPVREMAKRAQTLLRRAGDLDYLRRLHINLGSGHYHRERFAEAHASYRQALKLMDQAGQRDAVWASLQLNFGIACTQLADLEGARRAFREADDYGRANGLERLVAQAAFNLGALEALGGGYRPALRLLAEAEETLARQEVRELLAATYLEQAQIYLDLAMAAEGRDLARAAGESFRAEGMHLDAQLAHLAEARSLRRLLRPDEAVPLLLEAEAYYRRHRIPTRRAQTMLELARTRLAQGEFTAAGRAARSSIALAEPLRLRSLACAGRCFQAELSLQRHRISAARDALRPLAPGLSRLPIRDRLLYWGTSARVARAEGRNAVAATRYQRAIECLEAQRALIPGLELRARSFEEDVRIYHEKIALLAASPRTRLDRLLRLMERARGRTFRELQTARAGSVHQKTAGMRAVLGSMVRRREHLQMQGRPEDAAEAEQLRRAILRQEKQITTRVRRLEAAQDGGTRSGAPRAVNEIRRQLAPDEALLEYFVAEGRILAAVLTRQEQRWRVLESEPEMLRATLDHLRLQLDSQAATASRPLGSLEFLRRSTESRLRELYRALLDPMTAELAGCGRLTIIPHDFLHEVPFECLHDGADYVDARWRVVRCPTADFLVERRGRGPRRSNGRLVAIAGTRTGTPFVEAEARRVYASWPAAGASLHVDPSPAEALAAMRAARLIHVSAHGHFRADNPLFSTLHLGREPLFLADVLETPLEAELAVLSACNTGQTFSGRGDALLGVAHAFLAAGTDRLVASLWRVHDEATAGWMEAFHRNLAETQDAVSAHHAAGRTMRTHWPHPFYWGGFCLLGA